MKRLLQLLALCLLAAGIVFYSCKKEEDPGPDPVPEEEVNEVTITLTSPFAGETYGKGDTVHIKAAVTGTMQMHGYEVHIKNLSDSSKLVFEKSSGTHGTSYSIDEQWVNDVSMHSDMELELKVVKDHDGNLEAKKVHFNAHPM